jgi:hypothetical protein
VLREHEAVVEERVALVRELDAHDARARALIEGGKRKVREAERLIPSRFDAQRYQAARAR